MKLLIAALGIVATLPSLAAQASPLESATRSFTITLHAGFDRAFESFGPVEEKNWSPEFDPAFIYRSGIDMHPDFAVFTTSNAGDRHLPEDGPRGKLQCHSATFRRTFCGAGFALGAGDE